MITDRLINLRILSETERKIMFEKKAIVYKTPDLSKMKEVIIDHRTKIYIAPDADADEAKTRYLARVGNRKL